jgi:1,4-dihydroxy-2-naphthoate octaprenyltransferase
LTHSGKSTRFVRIGTPTARKYLRIVFSLALYSSSSVRIAKP